MEDFFIEAIKNYGYIVLFFWSILEGELGLIMAGILSASGDMNILYAIIVAASGGFTGDQIYFWIGRSNKKYFLKITEKHRRKVAKSRLLLRKYGIYLIFVQRYLYGLRTIIPMSIGFSGFNSSLFAIVNLISAFIWASITICISYYFGIDILNFFNISI